MGTKRTIALKDLMAAGAVLSAAQHASLTQPLPAGVVYQGAPRVDVPVAPLQVFGVPYDLDLVVVDDHPDWDMHEYARLNTPDGPVWLVKDSRVGTLEQTIVADVEGLEHWLPEVPLQRTRGAVIVDDRSDDRTVDLSIDYTNVDGDPVSLTFVSGQPRGPMRKRNSSTMGHSRDHVLAVLDLSHRAFATRATTIRIGGQPRRITRILGLVPFRVALVQTQAGLSIGDWTVQGADDTVHTVHASGAAQDWHTRREGELLVVEQVHPVRTLRHVFLDRDGALELVRMEVQAYGQTVPTAVVHLSPALPDVRRPFEGTATSHYVIDVHGQQGHATGEVVVTSTAEGAHLEVQPGKPRWTLDRPMTAEVTFHGQQASVHVARRPR